MDERFELLGKLISNTKPFSENDRCELETGFAELDKLIGGLANGDFIVVGGRTAMGKTALAMNLINNISVMNAASCVLVSLEERKEQLIKRLVSVNARIPLRDLSAGRVNPESEKKAKQVIERLEKTRIYMCDDPTITIQEMKNSCRKFKENNDLGLIIIDGYDGAWWRGDNKTECSIPRFLKRLAVELNTPVVLFSNISRSADFRRNHIPDVRDLSFSGEYIRYADAIMFLLRDDYYHPEQSDISNSIAKLCIEHQRRNGMTGCVALEWLSQYNIFRDFHM